MASRIEAKQVTVPAGTALAAPVVTALPFQDGRVERLEIRIPPGPSGLVGFQVRYSGQRIIPFRDDTWIVADDEPLDWPLSGMPTGGAWSIAAYNTDIYPHTLYLRFHVDEIAAPPPSVVPIVPVIEQAPALSAGVPNPGEEDNPFADEPVPLGLDQVPA